MTTKYSVALSALLLFAIAMIVLSVSGCQNTRQITDALVTIDTSDAMQRVSKIDYALLSEAELVAGEVRVIAMRDRELRNLLVTSPVTELVLGGGRLEGIIYSIKDSVDTIKPVVDKYWDTLTYEDQAVLSSYYDKAKAALLAYEELSLDLMARQKYEDIGPEIEKIEAILEVVRLTMAVSSAL